MFKNNKLHQRLLFSLIILLSFLSFNSCQSVIKVDENGVPIPTYEIAEELNFCETESPYKYIFLRLYDVDYINPFYIANVLKFGINLTEVNDVDVTHAAMNFTLDDNFYGLTSGGEYELARESCLDTKGNKFLKKCDPNTSSQITYAIRLTEEEFENTKNMVSFYADNKDIHYDVGTNFKIAHFAAKRRFRTKLENRSMEKMEYPKIKDEEEEIPTDFVCSTFVAYVLQENVEYIGKWFSDNEINYKYVGVSDIPNIPGVVRLFSSKFYEYDLAAQKFIETYPEFEPYYSYIDFSPILE